MARRRARWLNAAVARFAVDPAAVARYAVDPAAVRAFGRPATHSAAEGEPPSSHPRLPNPAGLPQRATGQPRAGALGACPR